MRKIGVHSTSLIHAVLLVVHACMQYFIQWRIQCFMDSTLYFDAGFNVNIAFNVAEFIGFNIYFIESRLYATLILH